MCERCTHTHLSVWAQHLCESVGVWMVISLQCICVGCHKHAFVLTCVRVVVSWHHMCVCNTITIRRVHTRGCLCIIQYLATVSHSLSLWSPASPVLLSVNWKPNGLFDPIRAHAKSTLPSLEPARATHTAWQHPPPFCPAESRQAGITLFIDRRCEILLIDYL